ncbi:ABC transporter substrate-binding protein [Aestuariimicrobium soli]|uniref:ABC transporter substrate-binding protein n=1 Tax=Aestuariimicrobium soli TaxID=2035834 RepID=UPI003EB9862C
MTDHVSRRLLLAGVPAALVLAACSGQGGAKPGEGKGSSGNDGVLTVADGGPSYPKNFNWYGANQNGTAPGLNLIYESPFMLDYTQPGKLVPWLAESYEMTDDGTTMVFHLRKGVKWSDGTEMTAEDFAFTLGFVNGEAGADPEKYWTKKLPEATDKYTCKVFFHSKEFQQMSNYALYYPIFPAHIWKSRDRKTDTNENPVGTGPFTVESFDPQLVTYKLRDDYWGGKGNGVKTVKYVPTAPVGGMQSQLDRGELDVTEASAAGVKKDFVDKNPELNHYSVYPSGGSIIMTLNCTKLPFKDAAVRRAFRGALDLQAAVDLAATGVGVPSVTGLDTKIYADTLKPEYAEPLKADVEAAKKELADAGWTVSGGNLTKDGKSYPLSLFLDNADQVMMQMGQVLIDQWTKALGVKVTWQPTPTTVFNDKGLSALYDMWVQGAVPGGNYYIAYGQYAKSLLRPPGTKEDVWGNNGRWDNKQIQDALALMKDTRTDDVDKLLPAYHAIQDAVAKDAPFIPLYTNGRNLMWSSRKWTGFPEPASSNYSPGVGGVNTAIATLLALKPA